MTRLRIGIDLGGTKIEGVVLKPSGQEILRHRVATPQNNYAGTLTAIADVVQHLEQAVQVKNLPVGVGVPGSISPHNNLVRNENSTALNGRPLGVDLSAALRRDLRISNDANCLALSEARDGAAQGCAVVFAVILGTGCGGGLIVHDQLVQGANGLGGEFGHIPLAGEVTPGHDCYCGRKGCHETYLSGPAIVRDYIQCGGDNVKQLQDISSRASAGEDLATQILARHLDRVGRALAGIVNSVDPDVFVLGGGVSNLPGFAKGLPGAIAPHVFAPKTEPLTLNVKLAQWGDSSGVRGAAQLWEAEE